MKKYLSLIAFAAVIFAFTACLNDDGPDDRYSIGMGTLLKTDRCYSIAFDGEEGTCAVPDSSLIVYRKLQKPGQRVIAMYDELGSGRGERAIRLRDLMGVLTKGFAAAPGDAAADQALGNDLVNVVSAWVAGGFFNVKYSAPTNNYTPRPHLINAYDTGTNDSEGRRIIEFRHNLNGNIPSFWSAYSYVSFALPAAGARPEGYVLRYRYRNNEMRTVCVD